MKLNPVDFAVQVGVGQENLGGTAFNDHLQDVRLAQFVKRLGGQNHRRVLLPPSLQSLDDVALDARVPQERPGLIDEECLECVGDLPIHHDVIGAVKNVEEQRLKDLRVLLHSLKIEALEF